MEAQQGNRGAVPWAAAPHRVHAVGERGATTAGVPPVPRAGPPVDTPLDEVLMLSVIN